MSHYFDKQPHSKSNEVVVQVELAGLSFKMATDSGVFSHRHLDAATALLLGEAPAPPTCGDLLDLGCGTGAIAIALAMRSPDAQVWAIDTNTRALKLTADNAKRNKLDNIRTLSPDQVPAEIRFATIWSNPPIRIGKPALHELLLLWLGRLATGGSATVVVHKHLGSDSLQRWLVDNGHPTQRITSSAGFRVLQIDGPVRGGAEQARSSPQ